MQLFQWENVKDDKFFNYIEKIVVSPKFNTLNDV